MPVFILILALCGFAIAVGLFALGIIGAILTIVLRCLAGVLWVAVKILEHRAASADGALEIEILIEDDEPPSCGTLHPPAQAAHYARQLGAVAKAGWCQTPPQTFAALVRPALGILGAFGARPTGPRHLLGPH